MLASVAKNVESALNENNHKFLKSKGQISATTRLSLSLTFADKEYRDEYLNRVKKDTEFIAMINNYKLPGFHRH